MASAAVLLVLFVVLGVLVSSRPPSEFDRGGSVFFGQGTMLAWLLTQVGTFPFYVAVCVLLLGAGLVRRSWLPRIAIAIVTLLIAWQASDAFKEVFHRARPDRWLVHEELSYAYPSGHATLSLAFYGLWVRHAWTSDLSETVRWLLSGMLTLLIVGIGWSRLALGAHWGTDVVGGYLLGAVCLSLALAGHAAIGSRRVMR